MTEPSTEKMVSVVVPFYNEEESLPELYARLCRMAETQAVAFAFMFIDDGSTDGSVNLLCDYARKDARVQILRLSRNFGHQLAITAGMTEAEGDAVIVMDADLQDPPEVIPELLQAWRDGYEVVYAVRKSRAGDGWLKKMLAGVFYNLFHYLADVEMPRDAGDFRLIDRKVADALKQMGETHRYVRGLTAWVGFRQTPVYYERDARFAGVTKYPVWKSMRLAWDAMTSFSGKPLRLMTGLGLVVAMAGLLMACHIVIEHFLQPEAMVQGWASLLSASLLLGGIQLVSLGLVGQYVGRIFEQSKNRPLYLISERLGGGGSGADLD